MDRTLWSNKSSGSAAFFNFYFCGNKRKLTSVRSPSNLSDVFFVSNKEKKSDGEKLTPTQHIPVSGGGMLRTTGLTLIKTHDARSKIKIP